MQKLFAFIITLAMCFTLGACSANNTGDTTPDIPTESETSSPSPSVSSVPSEEPAPEITIAIKTKNDDVDVDGFTVATVNISYPVVSVSGDPTEASENLMAWAKSFYDDLMTYASELESEARSAYTASPDFFIPYSYNVNIDKQFESDNALMLIVYDSAFWGGAHSANSTYAVCLDMVSGNPLKLQDIAVNLDALISAVEENIDEQIKGSDMENEMFSDYADHIKDGIDDRFWYLNDEGLTIIYNEYMLAPFSSGVFQFTVPYDKLDGLIKNEWVLK